MKVPKSHPFRPAALVFLAVGTAGASPDAPHVPLVFEENVGQVATPVRYLARTGTVTALLTPSGMTVVMGAGSVGMEFVGATPCPVIRSEGRLPGRSNYFLGDRTYSNIPQFARVRYEGVYPGVDLVFRGEGTAFEYDLVLAPGADPGSIALRFVGADGVAIGRAGELVLTVGSESVRHLKPRAYQESGDVSRAVPCEYVLRSDATVTLRIGAYDPDRPLVVDPVLAFSARFGGVLADLYADSAYGIAVDAAGNAYVTGAASSLDFPTTPGAFSQTRQPGSVCNPGPVPKLCADAFVMKLDPTGTILYSTYLGGRDIDIAYGIAVDAGGNAYITGSTRSSDFPVSSGAMQTVHGGGTCTTSAYEPGRFYTVPCEDAFVVKLNPTGSALVFSTYLGGSGPDGGLSIAAEEGRSATIAGWTVSANFPVTNVFQEDTGNPGGFFARLDGTGTRLVYSSYLGRDSWAYGVALDSAGNAYVTGSSSSSEFPTTPGAFRSQSAGSDAFVLKVSPAGNVLYSALIGGSDADFAQGIAVDPDGNAYITGYTYSADYPISAGAYPGQATPTDAFLTKLDASGSTLVYSLRLGGKYNDGAYALALDRSGNAYLFGGTASPDFPLTQGAIQPCRSRFSGSTFLAKVDASGSNLLYSTYFGGTVAEYPAAVAVGGSGAVWLAGGTRSSDFPTTSPAPDLGYKRAAFVSKIDLSASGDLLISCIASGAGLDQGPVSPGEIIAVFGSGFGPETPAFLRLDTQGKVDTVLGGTRLWFDDVPAPLIYAQSQQVNAVVPYSVQGRTVTQMRIEYLGRKSEPMAVSVAEARPAVFTISMTGSGQGAILNQDGTVNSLANPAPEGSVISVYATGFGQTNPPGIDGQVNSLPYPLPILPVRVLINGKEAEVQYAGAAPGYVAGAVQINAKVPPGANEGSEPAGSLALIVGDSFWSQYVDVALK